MRAVILDKPGSLRIGDRPDPTPLSREVIVQVHACGICGTDLHILDGEFPPTPYPITPGHEFAGEVVGLGAGVSGLAVGDRVAVDPSLFCGSCRQCQRQRGNLCENWGAIGDTVDGGFAEYVAVPAGNCYLLPDSVDYAGGALVEPVACAVHAIHEKSRVNIGNRVSVGHLCILHGCEVHDGVLMNLSKGFTHLAVWNEMKGIWGDFKGYTVLYNAIWDAIKGDPRTAMVKVYGPYCIFTQHQDNRWGGTLKGAWGGVDPAVTAGVEYFLANAHGIDGLAIDGSQGEVDGNNTGEYNPKRLPPEVQEEYWYDVAAYCRKTLDAIPAHKGKPIVAMEAYWGAANRWPFVFRKFRDGGGTLFFIWHERDGVAGLIVRPDGSLTELGNLIAAERASGGAL